MPNTDISPTKSGKPDLRATDWPIIRHVASYSITTPEVVSRIVFNDEKDPGNALAALSSVGYLKDAHSGNPLLLTKNPKRKYYLIGPKALPLVGVPKGRMDVPGPAALNRLCAILWFGCMEHTRFCPVAKEELKQLFPKHTPPHNTPHVVGKNKDGPGIFRVMLQAGTAKSARKAVNGLIEKTQQNPVLRTHLESGEYGFAVLGQTRTACEQIEGELKRRVGQSGPLTHRARIVVGLGPTPQTLSLALSERKED